MFVGTPPAAAKTKIKALYIPLADHYAAAVMTHAKYRDAMKECDYEVQVMRSWPSLRGKFTAGQADVAFIICPLAMDIDTFSDDAFSTEITKTDE